MLLWHVLVCCASLSTAISTYRETHFLRSALNKQHRYRHANKHNRHHYHATKKGHSLSEHPYPPELEKIFGVEISNETESVVCRTKECKQMAKIMKRNMDKSVNPCDDFYQYACGKFGENNPIPPGEDSWSFFAMTEKSLELQLQEILEEGPKPDDLITVKLGKRYFRTCIDLESREKKGDEQLVTTVTRIGGWPMIMEPDEWDETSYTWQKVEDYYAALTGHHAFYEIVVYKNYENVSMVNIDLQRMPVGTDRLEEDEESSEASWNFSFSDEDEDEDDDDNDDNDSDEDQDEDEDKDKTEDEDENENENENENEDKEKFKGKNKSKRKLKNKLKDKLKSRKRSKLLGKRLNAELKSKSRNKLKNKIKNKIRTKRSDGDGDSKPRDSQEPNSNDEGSIDISISSGEDNRNLTQEYADLITEVAVQLAKVRGAEVTKSSIAADINDMLLFMKQLNTLLEEDIYEDDEKMTLGEFQQKQKKVCTSTDNGKINWIQKLTLLFSNIANIQIDENLPLKVTSAIFYKHLVTLLDETSSRTIVNYVHWYYISNFISATTKRMKDLHHEIAYGEKPSEETDLKDECVSEVGFNDIISYAFVKKFFPDEIKKTGEEMIENIQKEVLRQIAESEWLDEERRIHTVEKVQNIRKFVGYPSWYANTTLMKSYYKGLSVGPSYFENKISYVRYHTRKNLQLLKTEDSMENSIEAYVIPLMLNAMFAAFENAMIVTAADFQNPFFALSRPQVINYGIVGAIMGHEVNHGFDDDGMKFDKTGTRVEWISSMAEAFSKRVDCFIDQYDDLARKNRLFNKTTKYSYGNRTKDENIADTMGLEAALGAYRISRENKGDKLEELLPGLENFTTDQLFFLSYANTFCEVLSPDRLKSYGRDVHSPGQLRVLGPISNSENFAKAFDCPVGSPMNPEKKCNIWK